MNFFKCTVNFFKQFPKKSHIQTTVVSNRGNTSFLLYNLNSVTNISGRSHFNPAVKNYHAVSHTGQIPSPLARAGAGSFSTCWGLSQCQSCPPEGCPCCMQRCRGSTHTLHCTGAAVTAHRGHSITWAAPNCRNENLQHGSVSDIADWWKNMRFLSQQFYAPIEDMKNPHDCVYFHHNYDTG